MLFRCELGYRERFEIEKGTHRFQSLIVTLRGEYEYSDGRETKRVLPFHPIVFKKGAAFEKRVVSPIEFIIVSADRFLYDGGAFFPVAAEDAERVRDSVLRLKRAILEGGSERAKEHYLEDILLLSASAEKTAKNPMEPAYRYIAEHFGDRVDLPALAKEIPCSVQTLIAGFKRHYGKTPWRCITEHRMAYAKELLATSALTVGGIAERCGYENVYYFSNVFKKETGLSPLNYRKSMLL